MKFSYFTKFSFFFFWLLALGLFSGGLAGRPKLGKPKYYVAIDTKIQPKYDKDFRRFEYTSPNAKKGGEVTLAALGTFDTLNPFADKGNPASGLGKIYDSLMSPDYDEHSVQYLNLASAIFYDKSRTWVAYQINPKARWHDGKPITAKDVVWTFNTLIEKGQPIYRFYYQDVKKVSKLPGEIVYFEFKKSNAEMPYILGQFPILPKHFWKDKDFSATDLNPPLGSGPYKIRKIIPGSSIRYERVPDYWGKDLPVNVGFNNPDTFVYEYYRDQDVIREAVKGGKVDFFQENTAKEWEKSYNIKAVKEKKLIKQRVPDNTPAGLQALIFNIRKPIFKDPQVRLAINYAFDFEWINKTFFYGNYVRSNSYFNNSDFVTQSLPGPEELKILNSLKNPVPPEVFNKIYTPPKTDGSGRARKNLRIAKQILEKQGWKVKNGVLTHEKTGEQMKFGIMFSSPAFERIFAPFQKNLKLLGIEVQLQREKPDRFLTRTRNFDYDIISGGFGQTSSPGNEQWDFWGSKSANQKGSRNYIGVQNPAIDETIEKITSAQTRKELITSVKVLDRILLWNHYVIPLYYYPYHRLLYRNKFSMPERFAKYDYSPLAISFLTWWVDPEKEKKL